MTIASETNKSGPYFGNGVTTTFEYDFKIDSAAHIRVVALVGAIERDLVLSNDYTVTGVGDPNGGSVILTAPPASMVAITLVRNVPFTQEIDLQNQGAFFAETIERGLDLSVMRDQQLAEEMSRTIKVPTSGDAQSLEDLIIAVERLEQSSGQIGVVAESIDAVDEVADALPALLNSLTDITNFADVYQGPRGGDPVQRNDGTPLQPGDLYFRTAVPRAMRVYDGTQWNDAAPGSLTIPDGSLALAKLVNAPAGRVIGRAAGAGSGSLQMLTFAEVYPLPASGDAAVLTPRMFGAIGNGDPANSAADTAGLTAALNKLFADSPSGVPNVPGEYTTLDCRAARTSSMLAMSPRRRGSVRYLGYGSQTGRCSSRIPSR
ncbi:MAG: hypothetical protein K0R85_324 [Devosia sp.]|jgi:hypothetical protein|nr:hypothetical protein [Devosia sp.]